jgi:hypothetical protein
MAVTVENDPDACADVLWAGAPSSTLETRLRGATLVYYAVARERVAAILAGSVGPVLSVERFGA